MHDTAMAAAAFDFKVAAARIIAGLERLVAERSTQINLLKRNAK